MGKSTTTPPLERSLERALRRQTQEIRQAIDAITLVCSGTLSIRTKVCGKPTCRCATEPEARHGPYYEWTRRVEGRYRHSVVSPRQAELIEHAIANSKEIQRLLRLWEAQTAAAILDLKSLNY